MEGPHVIEAAVCNFAAPWTASLNELTDLTLAEGANKFAQRPADVPESYSYDADYLNENGSLGAWLPPELSAKRQAIEVVEDIVEEKEPAVPSVGAEEPAGAIAPVAEEAVR